MQGVTGAERLGAGQASGQLVTVIGYPGNQDSAIFCVSYSSSFSATQLVFRCGGYITGTSGNPLLAHVDAATGLGTVIGVIGGYQQGGMTEAVSYAARARPGHRRRPARRLPAVHPAAAGHPHQPPGPGAAAPHPDRRRAGRQGVLVGGQSCLPAQARDQGGHPGEGRPDEAPLRPRPGGRPTARLRRRTLRKGATLFSAVPPG